MISDRERAERAGLFLRALRADGAALSLRELRDEIDRVLGPS